MCVRSFYHYRILATKFSSLEINNTLSFSCINTKIFYANVCIPSLPFKNINGDMLYKLFYVLFFELKYITNILWFYMKSFFILFYPYINSILYGCSIISINCFLLMQMFSGYFLSFAFTHLDTHKAPSMALHVGVVLHMYMYRGAISISKGFYVCILSFSFLQLLQNCLPFKWKKFSFFTPSSTQCIINTLGLCQSYT